MPSEHPPSSECGVHEEARIPIVHSIFSSDGLRHHLLPDYDLGEIVECRLLQHNQNDTYLVQSAGQRYILRVYQAQGLYTPRRASDMQYELELLRHLERAGVAVAAPIARRDGALRRSLPAPEGCRQAALFRYLPGAPVLPDEWDADYLWRYGAALAMLHHAADSFVSDHGRFALDLNYLLTTPLRLAERWFADRPGDWADLLRRAEQLRQRVADLEAIGLRRGICHGDALGKTNVHVAPDGALAFYDFECCGPGWLAYDLGVFAHALVLLHDAETAPVLLSAFLDGYQERLPLGAADRAAIPVFEALRHFWVLGLRCGNWENWGEGEVNERALNRWLDFWPGWDRRQRAQEVAEVGDDA